MVQGREGRWGLRYGPHKLSATSPRALSPSQNGLAEREKALSVWFWLRVQAGLGRWGATGPWTWWTAWTQGTKGTKGCAWQKARWGTLRHDIRNFSLFCGDCGRPLWVAAPHA